MKIPRWKTFKVSERSEFFVYNDYTWSIVQLQNLIKENNLQPKQISIEDLKPLLDNVYIDNEYAMSRSSEEPIIIIECLPYQKLVADGNHRLYRDVVNNKEDISAYIVPFPIQLLSLKYKFMHSLLVKKYKERGHL